MLTARCHPEPDWFGRKDTLVSRSSKRWRSLRKHRKRQDSTRHCERGERRDEAAIMGTPLRRKAPASEWVFPFSHFLPLEGWTWWPGCRSNSSRGNERMVMWCGSCCLSSWLPVFRMCARLYCICKKHESDSGVVWDTCCIHIERDRKLGLPEATLVPYTKELIMGRCLHSADWPMLA